MWLPNLFVYSYDISNIFNLNFVSDSERAWRYGLFNSFQIAWTSIIFVKCTVGINFFLLPSYKEVVGNVNTLHSIYKINCFFTTSSVIFTRWNVEQEQSKST